MKHVLNPRIKGMRCLKCGREYPVGDYFYGCPACLEAGENSAITFVYGGPAHIREDKKGVGRYADFLPYSDAVTLGEGGTPGLDMPRLAEALGVRRALTKHEFQNPTGSHKDRMNPFITARAASMGYKVVTCASSGNEAASLAAYAAAEGLDCVNVSAKNITPIWKHASDATGAKLALTETSAERLTYQRAHMDEGWYCATNLLDIPTSSSPFGIQGYKTIAYEIFEDWKDDMPDCVMIPTCRGDLLYGVYEGFADLVAEDYLEKMPRLAAAEPIPRLSEILEKGRDHKDKFPGDTSAFSSIGGATATWQSVVALRGSGGFAVSAEGADAAVCVREFGGFGLYLETSSAIVGECVRRALKQGKLSPEDSVMLVLTSNGYKNRVDLEL